MILSTENGKEHRNVNANVPMVWKYHKGYYADIYMIRLMRQMRTTWKPHRNPVNFVKARRRFASRMKPTGF